MSKRRCGFHARCFHGIRHRRNDRLIWGSFYDPYLALYSIVTTSVTHPLTEGQLPHPTDVESGNRLIGRLEDGSDEGRRSLWG